MLAAKGDGTLLPPTILFNGGSSLNDDFKIPIPGMLVTKAKKGWSNHKVYIHKFLKEVLCLFYIE
jgi:hypothetical protein